MTEFKNTSDHGYPDDGEAARGTDARGAALSDGVAQSPTDPATGSATDDDRAWESFLADHADDLEELDGTRAARRFEREAKKQDRLRHERYKEEARREYEEMSRPDTGDGPRDFRTSALDDHPDDHFTPPDPNIETDSYTVAYVALLILGVALTLVALLVPAVPHALWTVGGLLMLLGVVALVVRRR